MHFPELAKQLDQWNALADGWTTSVMWFQGVCHKTSEKATNDLTSSFPQLLRALGEGEIEAAAVTWRIENNRLEASWQQDIDGQPAWSQITRGDSQRDLLAGKALGPVIEDVERVWETVRTFPNLQPVVEWRRRRVAHDTLRPRLLDALEQAELVVELKGKCAHCPR